jgi:hypothetical protein
VVIRFSVPLEELRQVCAHVLALAGGDDPDGMLGDAELASTLDELTALWSARPQDGAR